jgi:hypothetical protein
MVERTGVRLAILRFKLSHPHPTSPKGRGDVAVSSLGGSIKDDESIIDRRRKRKRHRDGIHWRASFHTLLDDIL